MPENPLKRRFARLKLGAIHPFILPVFPVLSLYLNNLGEGFLPQAAPILVGVFVLALASWGIVHALVKNANLSALIVSTFFVFFFSFGHALNALRAVLRQLHRLNMPSDALWLVLYARHSRWIWAAVWIALFAGIVLLVIRRKSDFKGLTEFLNFVAVTLVIVALGNFFLAGGFRHYVRPILNQAVTELREFSFSPATISPAEMSYQAFMPFVTTTDPSAARAYQPFDKVWLNDLPTNSPSTTQPDLYYIIPDMYVRADYLTERYHCDTSAFLAFLEARGFYVAHESLANYPYTTHSLASSLNYMYINDLAEQVGEIREHTLSHQMIGQNRMTTFLKTQGYKTMAFATGFWFTELVDADIYMKPTASNWNLGEFEAGVIQMTPLSAFPVFGQIRDETYRLRTLYTLAHIADGAALDAPTFVFAHILAPHGPYVFDAYGDPVPSQDNYTYEEYVKAYCDQTLYISRRLQEVVHEILTHSSEPPIIIIQGDHGSCYDVDYRACIDERLSILNAYYFPNQDYEDLYPSITPVNTFRVVLNNYFGAEYELLDDASYYATPDSPYDFVDVTQEVLNGLSE